MENEIREVLEKYTKEHPGIICTLYDDVLSEIFKISMEDLETNKKIATGIFEQCIELSQLRLEDIVTHALDDMYSKLKKNI